MIILEKIHQEMNSEIVRDIADIAFEAWLESQHEKNVDALMGFINGAFHIKRIRAKIHQKLAVEVLLSAKFDNFIKERKTFMQGEILEQCNICMNYYLYEALEYCDSCDSRICTKCSKFDEYFDMVFCSECHQG